MRSTVTVFAHIVPSIARLGRPGTAERVSVYPQLGPQMNAGLSHVGQILIFRVKARREVNKFIQTEVTALSKIRGLRAGQMVSVIFMF